MKKVKFTLKQVNEVLNVAVDIKNNDVKSSIQSAKTETDRTVGAGVERNYVISGDEVNETYTKKQIEKARLKKINENGICLTKKKLKENFRKINELDLTTYMNAANKALKKGQIDRSGDFSEYGNEMFQKEMGNETNSNIEILRDGFDLNFDDGNSISYNINTDEIYDPMTDEIIEPGDPELRLDNRRLIMSILSYFKKFAPDSKYNNKDIWVR